jgi:hypothetical protein
MLAAIRAPDAANASFGGEPPQKSLACQLLLRPDMPPQTPGWTIPLHVIMWTTISVGFIMMLVVFLMHC